VAVLRPAHQRGVRHYVVGSFPVASIGNPPPNHADAVTWTLANAAATWVGRTGHACIHFNNAFWVLGGLTPLPTNDIYYSAAGGEEHAIAIGGKVVLNALYDAG